MVHHCQCPQVAKVEECGVCILKQGWCTGSVYIHCLHVLGMERVLLGGKGKEGLRAKG